MRLIKSVDLAPSAVPGLNSDTGSFLFNDPFTSHENYFTIRGDHRISQPPNHKNLIVASNFGRIGKIGDEGDLRCIRTGKSNLELNSTGKHFEDELILLDASGSGNTIGALGVVFNYKRGDDKAALAKIAQQVRDEMKAQLPNKNALFGPA